MTKFENRVYQIIKKIPKGKVLTYKQVAEKLGNVKLARAVGNALNKNRDLHPPKFSKKTWEGKVPCHRVIRSDGSVGGYVKGTKKKIELLKKEGMIIIRNKIKF